MGNKLRSPTNIGHLSLSDSSTDDYLYIQGIPLIGANDLNLENGTGDNSIKQVVTGENNNIAAGQFSAVFNQDTKAYSKGSTAIGNSTIAGWSNYSEYVTWCNTQVPVITPISEEQFGKDNRYQFATGKATEAKGMHSFTTGLLSEAYGEQAFAFGYDNIALGNQSVAGGCSNAFGVNELADADKEFRSNLVNLYNRIDNDSRVKPLLPANTSIVDFPRWGHSLADRSVNFGFGNITAGIDSLTIGDHNVNNGKQSFVFGKENIVEGDYYNLIGGLLNVALVKNDTAGYGSRAIIIDGRHNKAYALSSIIIGENNEVGLDAFDSSLEIRQANITVGKYLINNDNYKAVFGSYNNTKSDTLLEIGSGTADNARNNAFEITKNGTFRSTSGNIGSNNTLTANHSLIVGEDNGCTAPYAAAIGKANEVSHNSYAIGARLKTGRNQQVVVGYLNEGKNNTIFEVGYGNSSNLSRKTWFEVTTTGVARVYGAPVGNNDVTRKGDFKTVNGNSIIGSGDITVSGGGSLYMHRITIGANLDISWYPDGVYSFTLFYTSSDSTPISSSNIIQLFGDGTFWRGCPLCWGSVGADGHFGVLMHADIYDGYDETTLGLVGGYGSTEIWTDIPFSEIADIYDIVTEL